MIAAKAFDPVVGVDIHIIQPPGPVPPVPIPHPFVGMLIDPMDFAPIIGATVMVNGMPRATAGTAGKCIPPHIPIGGTFIKPPGNECEVFMGSATVLADGDPLSRLALPVLSCHDIGMPSPPRLKKKTKPKSLELPTSVVLAVPAGAPVIVGGPPTISMMALGMKAFMAGLSAAFKKLKKLAKASKKMKGLSDKIHDAARKAMAKLGIPPSVQNRVHRTICSVTGHPVDVATGKVFTEAVDLHLPGVLPFDFQRVWYSSSTYEGPLGHGWHHGYDIALLVDKQNQAVAVRLADGRASAFPVLRAGESFMNAREGLTLLRDAHGYALRSVGGLTYRFTEHVRLGDAQVLASVEDRNGNALQFGHDSAGRLVGIRDSAGRVVSVVSDARGRITALLIPDPRNAGESRTAVSYRYDEHGDLVEARDALGNSLRYAYANHLLVRETDCTGLSYYFVYDQPRAGARCIRTWGDEGLFARDLEYIIEAGMTVVTDGYGQKMTYYWNPDGLVERIVGPDGATKHFMWDESAHLTAEIDPAGNAIAYQFDEAGNRTAVQDAAGATTTKVFNKLNLPVELVNAAGDKWRYEYDGRGNLISIINPLGNAIRYTNEARGLPVEIHDAAGGITRLAWDARGDLVWHSDAAGGITRFEYDAVGQLIATTDALGHRSSFTSDDAGRLTRLVHADGGSEQFSYDGLGRLVTYEDPLGQTRQFRYRSGDRPTERIDHDGRHVRFEYDQENRLVGIINQNGVRYQLAYDGHDNLVSEIGFDGRIRRYEYNVAGQLMSRREGGIAAAEPEQVISFVRDAVGRLTQKILPDGIAEFAYDALGRLIKATNATCAVEFVYDAIGNLVEEKQGDHLIVHEYDALGNRTRTVYPTGEVLTFDFERPGTTTVALNGKPVVVSVRDALQRELRRSQGALESAFDYDPLGRLKRQLTHSGSNTVILREYSYDLAGHLTAVNDRDHGRTTMTYDVLGRLTQMLSAQARDVLAFDPADNLIDSQSPPPNRLLRDNRMATHQGARLEYDERGNVVAKRVSADRGFRFRYDAEHQLVEVVSMQPGSSRRTEYAYDALGRRITKRGEDSQIEFIWSASQLLQQRSRAGVESFIYNQRSMVPLASWNGDGIVHFQCDQLGTLREVTRHEDGKVVWRATYRAFGRAEASLGNTQPFRFPGHYYDAESGLHYSRFRYYDPDFGRYLTQDPAGLAGGFNPYVYSPDPVNYIDPLGLQRRWAPLGDGWEAGVDQFNTGGSASHEMHIYDHTGTEVGVVGPQGEWIPKHGHPPTRPPSVSDDMCRRINGHNVDQLRREGHIVDRARSREMFNRTCGR